MAALLTLSYFPGTTVGELGEVLGLTGSGAVKLLDRLDADGFTKRYSGNGRQVIVRLTDRGRRQAQRLQHDRLNALERLLRPLTADERRQLSRLVSKLLRHAELPEDRARTVCRLCDHRRCDGDACPIGSALRNSGEAAPRAGARR
jgi:DNA-binding MarR family transcriptional regulator